MWLKPVNVGQGHKIDAHIKQMALLNQKKKKSRSHNSNHIPGLGQSLHRYIRLKGQPNENMETGYYKKFSFIPCQLCANSFLFTQAWMCGKENMLLVSNHMT